MPTVKSQIEAKIKETVKKEYGIELSGILVYHPPEEFGDYATSIALQLARSTRGSKGEASQIAGKLAEELRVALKGIVSEVQTTPQGFLNFTLDHQFISKELSRVLKKESKSAFPKSAKSMYSRDPRRSPPSPRLRRASALIEFVSANPTGPLTLGNARNAFLGQTLANVLEKVGYRVIRHYYVNDTGRQIEQLGRSVLGIETIYQGEYIESLRKLLGMNPSGLGTATRRVSDVGAGSGTSTRRVSNGDAVAVGEKAAQIVMKDYIKPTLERLGIKFDAFVSERELISSGKVKKILERIKRDGLLYEKEGALWINLKKLDEHQDEVLIKSDGSLTYLASDIAYHWEKMRQANLLVTVLGADNANEARRIKVVVEKYLGNLPTGRQDGGKWGGKIVNILYQLVHLKEGGSLLKISKRVGRVITIEDLLGAVGPDAARFFILLPAANTHLELDLALMKEKSAKNPVYYVQYAHARMASILRKAQKKFTVHSSQFIDLEHPAEMALGKKILMYPELLEEVVTNFSIHHLPNYAIELADTFHKFYEQVRVIGEDRRETESRLALVMATKLVLKETLELLGVGAPERM